MPERHSRVRHFRAIICRDCGEGLVECPNCRDRGEYALLCVNPRCERSGKGARRRASGLTRAQRLRNKKKAAGQCLVCPLGSPKLIEGTLCATHQAAQRQRWNKIEAKRAPA